MIQPVQKELYAVIGNPVGHSLSPLMMNTAFAQIPLEAIYVALQLDNPQEDLWTLHKVGFKGLSVTLPHKEWALKIAAQVDETAKAIGAVNTLKRTEEGWIGCNTDWVGSNLAFKSVLDMEGKSGLVLGAGGAARAVVYGLQREGVHVTITNRGEARGASLARAFRCRFIPLKDLANALSGLSFDLVAQCTPVGLEGDLSEPIVPGSLFRHGMVVMDTVYRPFNTAFVREASKAGCTIVSGLEMLLYQGVEQLKYWLDLPMIDDFVIQKMREILYEVVNSHE